MGRGYSNSRSKSARPTLRTKRQRSASLQRLMHSLPPKETTSLATKSAPKTVVRKTETPRPAPKRPLSVASKGDSNPQRRGTARSRSASTIRQRVQIMETALASELEPDEKLSETIAKPDVMTKYKSAGRALDEVMDLVAAACVPGANTKPLCDMGDTELLKRVRGMFSKAKDADGKRIQRGLSYPTNISVNHTLCNHAPLSAAEGVCLRGGDVVKIHMGCHIDGYPVAAARTILVPRSTAASGAARPPLTRGASHALEAARVALLGLLHLLRPGASNADMTDFIHRVGNHFGAQALEGVLSNRTKRWVPDGMDCIITRRVTLEDPHQDVADCRVGANQVWTLDVAFTDNESYKVVPADDATTIFRRTEVDFQNDARVRSVHASLDEINEKHQCFPFSLQHVENPLKMRMAVTVLRNQNVIDALPVLRVRGERHITARFCATVAVSDRRVTVLCGMPAEEPLAVPDEVHPAAIPDDVKCVLSEPLEFARSEEPRLKKRRTEGKKNDNEEEEVSK